MNAESPTLLWHSKEKSWLEEGIFEAPQEWEVVIQSECSLVSHGTERTIISDKLTNVIAQKMKVPYMRGDLQDTFTYGYSLVGTVVEGDKRWVGKRVHLLHPHQDVCLAKQSDLYEIPENIKPSTGALASNMETAVNAIWDAQVDLGEKVLVIGYGLIGAMITSILKSSVGIQLEVAEVHSERRAIIRDEGVQLFDGTSRDFDVVINTAASAVALKQALEATRQEGRVVEVSWYGSRTISLELGSDFHYGRKQLIGSQVSQIPSRLRSHWDYRKRKDLVFRLLAELSLEWLIDQEITYGNAPVFYNQLRKGEVHQMCTLINYE